MKATKATVAPLTTHPALTALLTRAKVVARTVARTTKATAMTMMAGSPEAEAVAEAKAEVAQEAMAHLMAAGPNHRRQKMRLHAGFTSERFAPLARTVSSSTLASPPMPRCAQSSGPFPKVTLSPDGSLVRIEVEPGWELGSDPGSGFVAHHIGNVRFCILPFLVVLGVIFEGVV